MTMRSEIGDRDAETQAAAETRPTVTPRDEATPLARGAVIGRYLVLSLLGRGGMGAVYATYDPELDRRVALKLLDAAGGSEDARKRLVREARAMGKLSHPNVVQVYDVGLYEGDVFIAMELVEGESFDVWCRREVKPSWQDVLAAYLDAARGLCAAHEKGLVHRDVKPGNLLRGNDGRVRVVDFGIASGGDDEVVDVSETLPATSQRIHEDERLTTTGMLLGTPLYMAPEQHVGTKVSPASDQYSLCVALYEGLYGTPPFTIKPGAGVLMQLQKQKTAGAHAPPPPASPVPAWVYRALVHGLAPKPEDRYPSMEALIAALSEDPDARRRARWRNAAAGAAMAAVLGVGAVGMARSEAFQDHCAHTEHQLAGVWDAGVKGRLRAAFSGTGRPYAEGTVTRVVALLDRYAGQWSAMRGEVCRASHDDRTRHELLGLRDLCLDRRRGQLQALTTVFADKPDVQVLDKAVEASVGLYPIDSCADTEALSARVRPPEDPALWARVAALQPQVDRLEALDSAGKYKDGLALGEPLLGEAAAIPYAPLRAQAQYWVGKLQDRNGDYDRAKGLLRDAVVSAAEGRDDVLAASAWTRLLLVVGDRQRHFEEAAVLRALGPAAVLRVHDEQTLAGWLHVEGGVLRRMGKLPEAKATLERALAIREKVLGPDHLDVAATRINLGTVLEEMGDYPNARAHLERALAMREKALGPDHPDVALSLNNLGIVLMDMGDYEQARATHERALAVQEKALGPDHPDVAASLNNLSNVAMVTGDYARARVTLERALAIWEKALGPDHPDVAGLRINLGVVLRETGEYPQAAATLERARAIWEKALGPDHPAVAESLEELGRTLIRQGQLQAARPLLERARALREKALGPAHPDLAASLLGLGELALARHTPEEAVPLLERALTLDNVTLKPVIQLTLAEALWQADKERPRALALAGQARAFYERIGHRPGLDRAKRWLAEHPLESVAAASTSR